MVCVCLTSDMRGCGTCEGVGLRAHYHVFEREEEHKERRRKLWEDLAARGLPQKDVDIWPVSVALKYSGQTTPTGIRLTHVPTGLSVEVRTHSGTQSLVFAARKLYDGLRKAQEGNLT